MAPLVWNASRPYIGGGEFAKAADDEGPAEEAGFALNGISRKEAAMTARKASSSSKAVSGQPSARRVFAVGASAASSAADALEAFYAPRRTLFERQTRAGRATILRNSAASFLFDYNTAEAVLLASAVLINLAGICFDSSRFTDAMMVRADVRADYDALAYAVATLIIGSVIFWFASMGMDLALVLAPASVNGLLGRLEVAGRHAQQLFDPVKVRFYVTDDDGFEVSILLDNVLLAGFKGEQAMEAGWVGGFQNVLKGVTDIGIMKGWGGGSSTGGSGGVGTP
jgi:hypothetical protein